MRILVVSDTHHDAFALRAAIQKHLRTHKNVKSFRLGRYGEGETGVTVVELK